MCSTSVFSRLSFSLCLVKKPFNSPSISYCSCLPFATRAWSSAQRSSTAMNSSGLSPILTSNSWTLLLPPPLLLLSSRTCSQPSSLPLLVLPSTVASPSPSLWVLCQKLSPGRRTPEPYCPVSPVSSLPSVAGRTSRLLFLLLPEPLLFFPELTFYSSPDHCF